MTGNEDGGKLKDKNIVEKNYNKMIASALKRCRIVVNLHYKINDVTLIFIRTNYTQDIRLLSSCLRFLNCEHVDFSFL